MGIGHKSASHSFLRAVLLLVHDLGFSARNGEIEEHSIESASWRCQDYRNACSNSLCCKAEAAAVYHDRKAILP